MVSFNRLVKTTTPDQIVNRLRKHVWILIILIAGFVWLVGAAQGQSKVALRSVQVGLFPEYDRSDMLVVLDIALSSETAEPQLVSFQVPACAEALKVYQRSGNGTPAPLATEISVIGKWHEVRFSTDAQKIQIEYYDPNLVKEGDLRFYEYQWVSIYDVPSLKITLRQPFGAGEIQAEPSLEEQETGPDTAIYYSQEMGSVPAGELFTINLSYTRDIDNPANPALPVEPAERVSEATPGRSSSPLSVIMWLLTVALAVLVLVSLYYWWFKANVIEKQDRIVQGVGIMNPEKQAVFCHECGMRSRPGDSYCSNCGTELRRPTRYTAG